MGTTRGPRAKRTGPTTTVQISTELAKRLDRAADERLLGRRLLAEALISNGLDRLPPAQVLFTDENGSGDPPAPAPEPGGSAAEPTPGEPAG